MRLDWDDLRIFLAVARSGSLSAAARALGTAQPTVGRRLAACERRLGTRLLARKPGGYSLTEAGAAVLRHVEAIDAAALSVERIAAGRDAGLAGVVRLTCTDWIARRVLAPIIAGACAEHPAITVELVADVRAYSLAQREADVAVRLGSFAQREVLRRKLAHVAFGLYAAPAYLARHGDPDFRGGAAGHALLAMTDAHGEPFPDSAWLAEVAPRARLACRSVTREALAGLAAAGAGLATLPRYLGDGMPELRALATPSAVPGRDLWVGVHRDTRGTPRVRTLVEAIARGVRRLAPELDP